MADIALESEAACAPPPPFLLDAVTVTLTSGHFHQLWAWPCALLECRRVGGQSPGSREPPRQEGAAQTGGGEGRKGAQSTACISATTPVTLGGLASPTPLTPHCSRARSQ